MRVNPVRICRGANLFHSGAAVVAAFAIEDRSDVPAPALLERVRETLSRAGVRFEELRLVPPDSKGLQRIVVATRQFQETKRILELALANRQDFEENRAGLLDWIRSHEPTREDRELEARLESLEIPFERREPGYLIGHGKRQRRLQTSGDCRAFLDELGNLAPESFRIPIALVTGTNGKTTVTRMIAWILSESGSVVGMTTTDGIRIGRVTVGEGDLTGTSSARRILLDPGVDAAVLEASRGGIVGAGVGYHPDVTVLTNIERDHFGQDGIESIEDLIRIKRVAVEALRPGGTWVLNADDPASARLLEDYERGGRVAPFSLDPKNSSCRFGIRGEWLIERDGGSCIPVFPVAEISGSHGGAARFQVANALAALAACRALGLRRELVAAGLKSFRNELHNPGRNWLVRLPRGRVLMDYGHNPAAIAAVGECLRALGETDPVCVLGLPGDRSDALLEESARVAARYFPSFILREDHDRRGRAPGEVPELLRRAILREAPQARVRINLDGRSALFEAARAMDRNGITVLFYDERESFEAALRELAGEARA